MKRKPNIPPDDLDRLFEEPEHGAAYLDWDTFCLLPGDPAAAEQNPLNIPVAATTQEQERQVQSLMEAMDQAAERRGLTRQEVLSGILLWLSRDEPLF